jgi:hypothetical protein
MIAFSSEEQILSLTDSQGARAHGWHGFSRTPPVVIVHVAAEFIGEYPLRHPLKVWRDPSDRISALAIAPTTLSYSVRQRIFLYLGVLIVELSADGVFPELHDFRVVGLRPDPRCCISPDLPHATR